MNMMMMMMMMMMNNVQHQIEIFQIQSFYDER